MSRMMRRGAATLLCIPLLAGLTLTAPSALAATGTDAGTDAAAATSQSAILAAQARQREGKQGIESYTDRALVAVPSDQGVLVSWRSYDTDAVGITFTLKRDGETVYHGGATNWLDATGKAGSVYELSASEGVDADASERTTAWAKDHVELTLNTPADQTMPDGSVATYRTNDMSVADLNGDGRLDLVVKWDPSNAKDNSFTGYTGTQILDGYTFDPATGAAEQLWRIDLGINIRSGAHYTQFQMWDYDGDGNAEIVVKTADGSTTYSNASGTLTETGHVGAVSASQLPTDTLSGADKYDFRSPVVPEHDGDRFADDGRIMAGDEYLTAFDGVDGRIIDSTDYVPARGQVDDWGELDGYNAHRTDRYLAATAYLDGVTPSAVFVRGYYHRTTATAWQLKGGKLVLQHTFDQPTGAKDSEGRDATGGNHNLSVNDVDGDGKDEIILGAITLNSDLTLRYTTGLHHGDALHVGDWDNDGELEVFGVHEEPKNEESPKAEIHNASTGELEWYVDYAKDNGRGLIADIDLTHEGAEMWSSDEKAIYNFSKDGGTKIVDGTTPASTNFSLYWDGDLAAELQDHQFHKDATPQRYGTPRIQKWNPQTNKTEVIAQFDGAATNNDTKGNAGLVGDILGDWRDEVIVRDASDASKVRIYATAIPTVYRTATSLNNLAYREGLAWQNTAYNQPAHLTYQLSAVAMDFVTVGRFYASNQDRHMWTSSADETAALPGMGWGAEGYAFAMDAHAGTPVYRLYDGVGNQHLWTSSTDERDHLVGQGWADEGVAFYEGATATLDVYRLYNEATGEHLWTTSAAERDALTSLSSGAWKSEGVAFKALS